MAPSTPKGEDSTAGKAAVTPAIAPGPGQTVDPKTGKIYRIQPKKVRSPMFGGLQQVAEGARNELVAYCNEKSFTRDLKTGNVFRTIQGKDGKSTTEWVKGDKRLTGLTDQFLSAKKAVKDYKSSHPDEFQENSGKKGQRVPTMKVVNKPE
jgi:hypothetical protein